MENTQKEVWKDILEMDSLYMISNKGRVLSKSRKVKSSIQKRGYRITKERLLKLNANNNGYVVLYSRIDNIKRQEYIHRLVCKYFVKNPHNDKEVNHKNGNKSDNDFLNLEWCSRKYNINHAVNNNLIKSGHESKSSKLTKANVDAIRRLHLINPSFNQASVARKLKVVPSTIHKILNNQRWKK